MADKLSVTIGLEGGAEIQKQLADIGKAGQQAFLDIATAAEKVGGFKNLKPEEVTAKLKTMGDVGQEALNKVSVAVESARRIETLVGVVKNVEQSFAGLNNTISSVVGAVKGFGAAFAGLAVVKEVIAPIAREIESFANGINKASLEAAKLGVSIEKFDSFRRGLAGAGVGVEALAQGIQKINEATEKGKLDQVAKDMATLQEISKRGYGPMGTPELKRLVAATSEYGPVAAAANKALETLGVTMRGGAQSLQQLIAQTGDGIAGFKAFAAQLQTMPDDLSRTKFAMANLGNEFGHEVIQILQAGGSLDEVAKKWNVYTTEAELAGAKTRQTLNQMQSSWDDFKASLVQPVAMPILEFLSSQLPGIESGIRNTVKEVTSLVNAVSGMTSDPVANTVREFTALGAAVVKAAGAIGDFISSIAGISWDAISAGVAAWDAVIAKIQQAIEAVLKFLGLKGKTTSGIAPADTGGGVEKHASGGLLGGRGTGTSDSNLARVSRGEYIVPAHAVARPGVLSLLEGLRRGARIRGFAEGGQVGVGVGVETAAPGEPAATASSVQKAFSSVFDVLTNHNQALTDHGKRISYLEDWGRKIVDSLHLKDENISKIVDALNGHDQRILKLEQQPFGKGKATELAGGGLIGFAQGGLVGGFAAGGVVSMPAISAPSGAGGIGHLGTVDLRTDHGSVTMMASSSAVEQLGRMAATKRITSTGRKPGFVGG